MEVVPDRELVPDTTGDGSRNDRGGLRHDSMVPLVFKILYENHLLDGCLQKTADYLPKLNGMHPEQSLLVVDFVLAFLNGRPSLLFYNHVMQGHNQQQALTDKDKKRVREIEDRFQSLSVKEDLYSQILQIEKRTRSEVETSLFTLREKYM